MCAHALKFIEVLRVDRRVPILVAYRLRIAFCVRPASIPVNIGDRATGTVEPFTT